MKSHSPIPTAATAPVAVRPPTSAELEAKTLQSLSDSLGAPSTAAMRFAFRGADESWMLRQGQSTASESILASGASFVRSTQAIWTELSPAKRAAVMGYNPALDAVIVRELMVLASASHRYDVIAQSANASIGQRKQAARDALSAGIHLRLSVHQTLRDLLGATHPVVVGLDAAMKPADTVDVVANGIDKVAQTLHDLRHGDGQHKPDPELVQDLDFAQLSDLLIDSMRDTARAMRDTASLADARPHDLTAAQRSLDLQDGRVLHVIGLVVRAFRRARRGDPSMLVPDVGSLARNFGGSRNGRDDDEDPQPDGPAPTPTPTPPPAPVA